MSSPRTESCSRFLRNMSFSEISFELKKTCFFPNKSHVLRGLLLMEGWPLRGFGAPATPLDLRPTDYTFQSSVVSCGLTQRERENSHTCLGKHLVGQAGFWQHGKIAFWFFTSVLGEFG